MLSILRKFGSTNVGGSLSCPRCGSARIKRVDEVGDIDQYRCFNKQINIKTGAKRYCGQMFQYLRTPFGGNVPKNDMVQRPETLLGRFAAKKLDPMLTFLRRKAEAEKQRGDK